MLNSRLQGHFPQNFHGEKSEEKMKTGMDFWKMVLFVSWMGGVVVAEGGYKIFAILIPFYAWYLFMEKIMKASGII